MFYNYILSFLIFALPSSTDQTLFLPKSDNVIRMNRQEVQRRADKGHDSLEKDYLFRVKKKEDKSEKKVEGEYLLQQTEGPYAGIELIELKKTGVYQEEMNLLSVDLKMRGDEDQKLTKHQIQEKKLKAGFYLATATAELLDSIYLPYFSRGLFNIIGTGYKIKKYSERIKQKYGVSIEIDEDEAVLIYEEKF